MRKQLLPILVLVIAAITNQVWGFELKSLQGYSAEVPLKWNDGPVSITLNASGSNDLPIGTVEASLQKTMNSWSNVSGQSFRFQYAGKSSAASANSSDGLNSVVWVEQSWMYPDYVIAMTRYSYYPEETPRMADADILLNGQHYKWTTKTAASGNNVDLEQVLLHEFGHMVGLGHTSVYNSLLFPNNSAAPKRVLSIDDKAGMRFLYGSGEYGLKPLTPLHNAVYVQKMSEKGLPLPVFRWGKMNGANVTLEFSATPDFAKKYSIKAGSGTCFVLKASHEQKILALSTQKVYWRVTSGNEKSQARVLKFKSIS